LSSEVCWFEVYDNLMTLHTNCHYLNCNDGHITTGFARFALILVVSIVRHGLLLIHRLIVSNV